MGMYGDDRDVQLPSGRKLHIQVAEWRVSQKLYKAVAADLLELKLKGQDEVVNGFKDLICKALSSDRVEPILWQCFKTVTIDDVSISEESFQKIDHRDDYFTVCLEVAQDNIGPFVRSLLREYAGVLAPQLKLYLESMLKTTPSSSKSD